MNKEIKRGIKKLIIGVVPLIIVFIIGLCLVSPVKAEQQSLGTFKSGNCVKLTQTCANCTYINFTMVLSPDGSVLAQDLNATKQGIFFNYSLCNLSQMGFYTVHGIGDIDGVPTIFVYDFEVNQAGKSSNPNTIIALVIGIAIVTSLFFYFAFNVGEEHFLLKIILIFFGIITLTLIPATLVTGDYSVSSIFMNIPIWFFRIFVTYFIVYLFWNWIKSSENILSIFKSR